MCISVCSSSIGSWITSTIPILYRYWRASSANQSEHATPGLEQEQVYKATRQHTTQHSLWRKPQYEGWNVSRENLDAATPGQPRKPWQRPRKPTTSHTDCVVTCFVVLLHAFISSLQTEAIYSTVLYWLSLLMLMIAVSSCLPFHYLFFLWLLLFKISNVVV